LTTLRATPPNVTPSPTVAETPLPPATMRTRRSIFSVSHISMHIGLILICIGFLLPLVWMLSTSLKSGDAVMEATPRIIPKQILWSNYAKTYHDPKVDFPAFFRNTLIVASLIVAGTTISSAIVAYGFAKIRFKGRGFFFALMLSTMMIPFPVTMVALFSMFRYVGDHTPIQMLGTFRPLWVPAWFGSAFNIFLLRQFFMTIPDELLESARIDGCSEMGIFLRIIVPLSRPALAVVALFAFMAAWNDYMGPLVYIQDPQQYTLALGLGAYQSAHGMTQWNSLMAASLMIVAPIILLYFLAQKTFVQGIATTGMKG
jgi:multiple sugar transport system permease protein